MMQPKTYQWLPECLFDEGAPAPRAKPEDWLVDPVNGVWAVDSAGSEISPVFVWPGDTIEFRSLADFDDLLVTINPDASVAGSELPPAPPGFALTCQIRGEEDVAGTLDDLAADFVESWGPLAEPAIVEVAVFAWSTPIRHRLDIANGVPRLVRVDPASVAPAA
jgi:hypothetical protein